MEGQGDKRDFVGDWLVPPLQYVPDNYDLAAAERGYQAFRKDLDEVGPMTRNAFWAKAYGVLGGGAAIFQMVPMYVSRSRFT